MIAAKAKVDVLLDEQDRLKSRIKNLEELYDEKESESKGKLAKLKGYCEHKAEQYQSLTEDCDKKAKDLDILKETLQNNLMLNEELAEKITIMRKNKHDLDLEVHQSRNEIRDFKTVRQAEDERDKALVAVKKVADALNIEFSNSSSINELMNVVRKVEQSLSSLSDGLEKVEMFKKNKELFVDMYDKNTKELQEEWQALKDAKEEIQNEKYQIDMSRSEKRTLDEQVKQLTLATNELQKIKAALERDNLKIEDRNNLLKDSIKSYEDLKDKLQRDYQHMQAVHETETKKYEELMSDIQTAKSNYKQLKADKIESEAQLNNLRFQSAKLEDRSRDLEIEIKEQDKLIFKLKNKQTEEQARVYDDLKEVNKIINDKQKEIYSFQGLLADYESQRARKEEEILMAKRKIEADSLERELVETAIKNRQQVLRDVEGKISNAEMSLNRIQQDIETISQNFAQKTRKIAQLDLEIDQKHSDLERLKSKFENCSQELKAIDEIVRNNKAELRGLDETIVNKNYEADTILHQVNQKRQELGNVERQLNEKQTLLINDEQRLEDTRAQNQIEEESLNIMKQQAQSLSSRVSKLTEALERVEAHKRQVLNEIEVINQKMSKEEIKHKNELEQLRNAIGNGEQTLRQLMESVQRGRNKLAHDREESQQISEEIHNLNRLREEAEEKYRAVDQELNSLQSNVDKLKQEEDTAMVLLALSGHKIDETIKQRISKLCHSAVELEQVKAQLLDARNKDYKDFRFKKTNPALEELENTALYSGNKVETRPLIQIIEEPIEDYSSLIPENEDVRKILHNLEVTRERLRSLTPVNDLSYD